MDITLRTLNPEGFFMRDTLLYSIDIETLGLYFDKSSGIL